MRRLSVLGATLCLVAQAVGGQAATRLSFTSTDTKLVDAFSWASRQASAFAYDGDAVGPWFEAALPGREAFCMRDVAHQVVGAHALGMQRHVKNVLTRFAAAVSAERDWAGYWEINRHDQPAPVDYRNDRDFWYNLPANFDLLDATWRMYQWSGDQAYLQDPTFLSFYRHSVTDYVERWALAPASIMTRTRIMNRSAAADPDAKFTDNRGIPGYNEETDDFTVGLDLLAAEYAGFAAYARILEARGDFPGARTWLQKAGEVKALVNGTWWDEKAQSFHDYLSTSRTLRHRSASTWNSAALYWPVAADGPHARASLQSLVRQISASRSAPIEEQSHHPEVLYRYGANDVAYDQIMDLARDDRERREYPEVSFSIVGAIVTGVMGITVDNVPPGREEALLPYAANPHVSTLPQLTAATSSALLGHLPVRANDISVLHEGVRTTELTNNRGPALVWQATLPGRFESFFVNGKAMKATRQLLTLGREVSVVRLVVAPGMKMRVSATK